MAFRRASREPMFASPGRPLKKHRHAFKLQVADEANTNLWGTYVRYEF